MLGGNFWKKKQAAEVIFDDKFEGCLNEQQSVENVIMFRVYLVQLLALFFLVLVRSQDAPLPAGCYTSNYTSTFTRCDISFLNCYSRRILQSCHLRQCERYIRGGDCNLQISYVLDQTACYHQCCGSQTFDESSCNEYNQSAEAKKSTAQTALIIVLSIIAVILVFFVVWYSTKKMGCCDQSQQFKLIKFNLKWRKDQYIDCKCDVCNTYGPLLVTPCQHNFHVSCFQESAKDMICPKCQQPIKDRVKIFCFYCRERSFKVKIFRIIDLVEAIKEARGLHADLCPKEIKTNRRMLQSEEQL